MTRKIIIVLLFLSSASLISPLPQPIQIVCGFFHALFIPGLVFLYLSGDDRLHRFDMIFLPLILSPILLSILVLAVNPLLGSLDLSFKLSAGIFTACLIVLLLSRAKRMEVVNGIPRGILIICLAYGGVILASYITNPFLMIRSDAWYHASVANEIMNRGIPPKEPFLADIPIKYMWFYHLFLAGWKKLSGLSLFGAMSAFNVVNAVVFPYLIARMTSFYTTKLRSILITPLFAVAGLESASWILWPTCLISIFSGEVRGLEELSRTISRINLNGIEVMSFLRPCGAWMVNLTDKFLTVTAFTYSLNLFLYCFINVLDRETHSRHPARTGIRLFVVVLGALCFHVVTGAALVITAAGSWILLLLLERFASGNQRWHTKPLMIPAAIVLAAAIGIPYVISLTKTDPDTGGSMIGKYLHFGLFNIFTIIAPLIVLFCPARSALKRIFSFKDYRLKILGLWIICLILLNVFMDLPTVNESKLIFPLFMIMGFMIYLQIIERIEKASGGKRLLLLVFVFILFFIPPFMTFRGFILQKPDTRLYDKRYNLTGEDRRFFDWIKNETSKESVFMEDNIYHLIPAYAGRRNFHSTDAVLRILGYSGDDVDLYRSIHDELYSGRRLERSTVERLRAIKQDIYIVIRNEDIRRTPSLEYKFRSDPELVRTVYRSDSLEVYAFR